MKLCEREPEPKLKGFLVKGKAIRGTRRYPVNICKPLDPPDPRLAREVIVNKFPLPILLDETNNPVRGFIVLLDCKV